MNHLAIKPLPQISPLPRAVICSPLFFWLGLLSYLKKRGDRAFSRPCRPGCSRYIDQSREAQPLDAWQFRPFWASYICFMKCSLCMLSLTDIKAALLGFAFQKHTE